ncbi:Uncharacterized protein Adt_39572 [Abeliophyllum distichum]|uniref:Uncharacterized protein n=1 Tax=Abeliophyllum distichum TaxID=126358 RepID=A0ABD1Q5K1_9LAMI
MRLRNPERDSTPDCYDGRRTLGCPCFHEIFNSREKVSLSRSLRSTRLKELWTVTSIHHLCMKFSTEGCIATIQGNQPEARKCYRNALRKVEKKEINMTILDVEMEEASGTTSEDVEMEEASFIEDIDPRITGTDSQTSSVEEVGEFPQQSPMTLRRSSRWKKTSLKNQRNP